MLTKYTTALVAAMAAVVSAMPATSKEPILLGHDDVILPRADGGFDIMKDWEWDHIERRLEREARLAEATEAKRRALSGETIPEGANLSRRDCEESTEMQVLSDTSFFDWDVAMSPVIGATGGQAIVMVNKGYQVSNALAVGVSTKVTLIENVLDVGMDITSTTTWTTIDSQTFSFYVTEGQYGVVISNPSTRRVTGNLLDGCTDSPTVTPFTSDSRTSQQFGDLSWVQGPIRLCNSTSYPVPFCQGTGNHQ